MMDDNIFTQDDGLLPGEKRIWVVFAGTEGVEDRKNLIIDQNTQARDIIKMCGLPSTYALQKPDEGYFDDTERVHPAITYDNQKLHAAKGDVKAARSF